MFAKIRLDYFLYHRGFFESREKAQRAILAGQVLVNGKIIDKQGTKIHPESQIEITQKSRYVGRGGYKLEAALSHFKIYPTEYYCLDIGASTGGFTDCLLQHHAKHVFAIDVGYGQLAWSLRNDKRVTLYEKLNARYMNTADLPKNIDLIVIDVSFISLTMILPNAFLFLKSIGKIITLIKPQFELTATEVGKGGIVRDPISRQKAVNKIKSWIHQSERTFYDVIESPIHGSNGNIEYLALLGHKL